MAKVTATQRPTANPVDILKERLLREIGPVLDKGIRIRDHYTRDWSHYNTPEFYKHIDVKDGKLIAEIRFEANPAVASTEGLSVYELLRDGTDVRRANLTPDWTSKTKANSLVTKAGTGGLIDAGMQYEFPGIDPRNTDILANKEIEGEMKDAIRRAIEGR